MVQLLELWESLQDILGNCENIKIGLAFFCGSHASECDSVIASNKFTRRARIKINM